MALKKAFDDMFIESTILTVADVGIENTRTKDIASRTGFTEATMFRAFPTKQALLREAFLCIDEQVSNILSQNTYIIRPDNTPFELVTYSIWHKVYRYLVDHREETIFLIRYRYSSLYTDEVRSMRKAYDGGLDTAYEVFEKKMGVLDGSSWQTLIANVFEVTLCYVEKIITDRLDDTEEIERSIWSVVMNSIEDAKSRPASTDAMLLRA